MRKNVIATGKGGAKVTLWGFIGYSLLCVLSGFVIGIGSFFIAQ